MAVMSAKFYSGYLFLLINIICSRLVSFIFKLTQVFDNTTTTFRFTGGTHVAAMKNQPEVHIYFELGRYHFFEFFLDLNHIFTHGKLSAI